jgi:hypothetical protein
MRPGLAQSIERVKQERLKEETEKKARERGRKR